MVEIRTCKKKLKAKMQTVKQWITKRMHEHIGETLHDLNLKLKGHYQYYGINGNFRMLAKFYRYVQCITLKILRRRGAERPNIMGEVCQSVENARSQTSHHGKYLVCKPEECLKSRMR